MAEVNCLYCGERIADDVSHCPNCGAVSHYQQRGYRAGARRKFGLFVLILSVICIGLALWLPR